MAFKLQKNTGLMAIGVVILVVALFMLFGKTDRANDGGVVATDTRESEERETSSPQAQTPTQPKASAQTSTPSPAPAPVAGLNGYTFRLTSYNGSVIPGGDIYTVTFKAGTPAFEDGFITAKFCNTKSTSYRIKNGVISGDITGLNAYCPEPKGIMDLEGAFGVLIDGGAKLTLQGDSLTLTDNIKTMVFVRQ